MFFKRRSSATTLVIASLIVGTPASAQYSDDEVVLEEITVTAQRREQNLMDVPMSITAWSGELLEVSGIDNITLVADITPGLVASSQNSVTGAMNFFIRGIGSNAGGDPAVGYYVDEIYVGSGNAFNTSFIDLERVEILKGPQGTLWGRNTTGGAINLVSKRPSKDPSAEVFVEVADHNTQRFGIAGTAALSDTVSGRLTAYRGERDSFTQNSLSTRTDRTEDSASARAQLRFEPSEQLTVDFLYGYQKDDAKNLFLLPVTNLPGSAAEFVSSYFGIPPNENLFEIKLDEQPTSEYEAAELRLDVVFDISEQYRLRWLTGHNKIEADRRSDFDGNFLEMLHATNVTEDKFMSSELQLQYTGDRVDWTAGLYYFDSESDQFIQQDGDTDFFVMASCSTENYQFTPDAATCPLVNLFYTLNVPDIFFGTIPNFALPSLPYVTENFLGRAPNATDFGPNGVNPLAQFGLFPNLILETGTELIGGYGNLFDTGLITNQTSVSEVESLAVYAEANWKMSDAVTLTLGARYTEDEKKLTRELLGTLFSPAAPALAATDSRDKLTPKIGIQWRPNENSMLYGSVTTGFKGAGFAALNNVTGEITKFDEETVVAYEVGYKGTLADGRVRVDASAYFYNYDDMQSTVQFADGPITTNLDEVQVEGLDFTLDWAPVDRLSLFLSANLMDSEVTKYSGDPLFDPTAYGLGTIEIVGNPLPRAPETSANVGGRYTFDLGSSGSLTAGVSAAYTSEYNHTQFGNVLMTPSYTIGNANVTWASESGRFSVNVFGRNITDEEYLHTSFFTDASGVLQFPGAPRTVGVQVRVNLD